MSRSNAPADRIPGPAVWLLGIRPRTLTMAVVPVAVGGVLAYSFQGGIDAVTLAATLFCAVLIQIGTNLFNDASDGLRGADGPERLGPQRLTGGGLATAGQVKRAAVISFALAFAAGIYLVFIGGVVILAIGLASLVAGYAYSSGPRPLSYGPWGEIYVIVFFGVVAVAGSCFLQTQQLPDLDVLLTGAAIGCPAAAVLLVNNVRDLEADSRSGRRTLAARLGVPGARWLYALLVLMPIPLVAVALGWRDVIILALALPWAIWLIARFRRAADGSEMNAQLARTAMYQVGLGVLLIVSLLA